jgi:glycosyltransferase involved in cell wall biosynthesis
LTYGVLDRQFGLAAARRAARTGSSLLLYSSYAYEAFSSHFPHSPRKILFQYHPHPGVEQRILAADSVIYGNLGRSFSQAQIDRLPAWLARRERDVWRYADLIVCASQFTLSSVVQAGADPNACRVVPYGIDLPDARSADRPADFRAIFVGSGVQRKGLHHLLLAWQRANLPLTSKLTLVCRSLDPALELTIKNAPRVELIRGVSNEELSRLYSTSTLFVMPSLIEGFGQVYLEALAHGLPVLGSWNTGLPDLGNESNGIFLVKAGDIAGLAGKLEFLAKHLVGNVAVRHAASEVAAQFTWERFRAGLRSAISDSGP